LVIKPGAAVPPPRPRVRVKKKVIFPTITAKKNLILSTTLFYHELKLSAHYLCREKNSIEIRLKFSRNLIVFRSDFRTKFQKVTSEITSFGSQIR